jgi:uncharacterized protein YjbJ (UPF0337 family)
MRLPVDGLPLVPRAGLWHVRRARPDLGQDIAAWDPSRSEKELINDRTHLRPGARRAGVLAQGKAKEVAGAVTGNDSLTVEGIVAAYQQEQEGKQEIRREAQARAEAQKTQAEQTAENRRSR